MPQLTILRQESLQEESFVQNGQQKNVHVVAKGIAFTVVVSSVSKDVDFHKHVITASVIYDYGKKETEAKEVSFVNIKPLEYKAHVSERGTQANVELRMYVLSSQHENQTFRVRLEVEDLSLSVVTQSIRVISKVSLLNKKEKKATKKRHIEEVQSASSSPEQPQVGVEDFTGTLYRLEQQQQEQMRLLQGIAQFNSQLQNTLGSWPQIPSGNSVPQPVDFETAFQQMLESYMNLPQDQKPEKLRKVLSLASLQAPDFMECMVSDCAKSSQDPNATCTCPNCPYQKQVTDIDSFYNEFLASPERDSMDDFTSQAEPLGFLL